jgi:hypothetical protein
MIVVPARRPFTRWTLYALAIGDRMERAESRIAIDEEYWLALRFPAEVRDAGHQLLGEAHPSFDALPLPEKELVWREFRSHVRQADDFYRGARVLSWKSSPLNYYYSFMNLAKALAVARGALTPISIAGPRMLRHGLKASVVPGTPPVWRLLVHGTDDVFALLYRMVMGVAVTRGAEVDARGLLRYVSPIFWQLEKCGHGPPEWIRCKWMMVADGAQEWDILAIPRSADLARMPHAFDTAYQEIATTDIKQMAWDLLGMNPMPSVGDGFTPGRIRDALQAEAPNHFFPVDDASNQLALGFPFASPIGPVPMSELVAGYSVMYFLSSLVRYQPAYVDEIGESHDAWLIESFAKSASSQLLRSMTSEILGYSLIIDPS